MGPTFRAPTAALGLGCKPFGLRALPLLNESSEHSLHLHLPVSYILMFPSIFKSEVDVRVVPPYLKLLQPRPWLWEDELSKLQKTERGQRLPAGYAVVTDVAEQFGPWQNESCPTRLRSATQRTSHDCRDTRSTHQGRAVYRSEQYSERALILLRHLSRKRLVARSACSGQARFAANVFHTTPCNAVTLLFQHQRMPST